MDVVDQRFADVTAAVTDVYRVFGRYPLRPVIEKDAAFPNVCDDAPLRASTLEKIPYEAFDRYMWKAMTTWGSIDDFKHFLPRLVELHAPGGPGSTIDEWIVFRKMAYGGFASWPTKERNAVHTFNLAVWRYLLVTPDCFDTDDYMNGHRLRDWIDSVCAVESTVKPFTDAWDADLRDRHTHLLAVKSIAAVVCGWMFELMRKDRLFTLSSEDHATQEAELIDWLTAPRTLALLEDEYFKHQQKPFAPLLSRANELLTWRSQNRERAR